MKRVMSYLIFPLLMLGFHSFGAEFVLPVERRIENTDSSGKTWQEIGSVDVSLMPSRQMWELALRRNGWYFVRNIPLDPVSYKQLDVWNKDSRTLIRCLWSIAPGRTGYMWGISKRKP